MPWTTSTRRKRLPRDWPQRRRAVLNRDHRTCQLNYPGCTGHATEVDHRIPGDDHRLTNLQAACHSCHTAKTQAESHANRPKRARPAEPHPGLVDGWGDPPNPAAPKDRRG